MTTDRDVGREAERLAREHLESQGLRTLAQNYRCRAGEIDLIMREADVVVFVEVRYRGYGSLVGGAESVDHRKQRKLLATARHFQQRNESAWKGACRFDVVAIAGTTTSAKIQWIRNAFAA